MSLRSRRRHHPGPRVVPRHRSHHTRSQKLQPGEEKVILFNLSGHGLVDMASYDKYLSGDLINYTVSDEEIEKNLENL